jgi:hypothetical protein
VPRDCVRPLALEPRNGQEKFALGKQLARTYHHRLEAEAVPVRVIVAEAIATGTAVTDVAKNEVVLAHKNKRRSAKPVAAKAATVSPVGKLRSGHTGTPIPTASSVLRPPRTAHLDPAEPLPEATSFTQTPTTRRTSAKQTAPAAGPVASLASELDDVDDAQQLDTLNRLHDAYRSLASIVSACAARRRVPASVRLPKAVPPRAAFVADDLVAALQRRRAWDAPTTNDDRAAARSQAIAMEMVVLAAQVSEAAAVLQSVLAL